MDSCKYALSPEYGQAGIFSPGIKKSAWKKGYIKNNSICQ